MTVRDVSLAERLFRELHALTVDPPGVTRPSFSHLETLAHDHVGEAACALGLEVERDHVGNTYYRLRGRDPEAPVVLFGSHLDSNPHGGDYDGVAGVLAGLSVQERLVRLRRVPACDVVTVAFRGEEIAWFPTPHFGVRAALGRAEPELAGRVRRSDTGRTLAEHMAEIGLDPEAVREGRRHLDPPRVRCYVEVHIEQGPVLLEQGLPLGLVTGIRGCRRWREGRVRGAHDHAGGVPRRLRRDAVLAGAELLHRLDRYWAAREEAGADLVVTAGVVTTDPAVHALTKVPGELRFTLDSRSEDPDEHDAFAAEAARLSGEIGERRGVAIELGPDTLAPPAALDAELRRTLAGLCRDLGIAHMELPSGGGHDCSVTANAAIPSAMVFVRNANGSHNPDEHMALEDFAQAVRLADALVERLI